ncbi:MAG: hypothetical protein JNM79_14165 [Burkholderiales bacterium]|nr:hypothetical protein [Burkholderiales bacterium]
MQGIVETGHSAKPAPAPAAAPAAFAAAFKEATDRDLLLLRAAIDRRLLDPARVERIRQSLKSGTQVSYLSTARNRVLTGKVLDISDERVMIQATDGQLRWLHFAAVVLDDAPRPDVAAKTSAGARFAPGDHVSFEDKRLVHRFGTVVRVNPKTVTVLCDGRQQRIAHAELARVVDI